MQNVSQVPRFYVDKKGFSQTDLSFLLFPILKGLKDAGQLVDPHTISFSPNLALFVKSLDILTFDLVAGWKEVERFFEMHLAQAKI